jgi:membrane-bound ClpP family serine protease
MAKMRRVPKVVHPNLFQEHEAGRPLSELRKDCPPGAYIIPEDVTGVKGRQYARRGDVVKIVSDHDNVLIVENIETGERFPVQTEKLKNER